MKLNKKGFTAVEGLLVVVVIGAIAGAGWYVYQRQNRKEEPKQATITNFEQCKAAGYPIAESYPEQCHANGQSFVNESQKPQVDPQDETANWLLYEPPGKQYEIRIPDGWEVHRHQKESHLFSQDIVYKQGTKAVVIEDEGGRDFSYLPFGLNYFLEADGLLPTGTKTKTFKTKNGDEVILYTRQQTAEPEGIGPPKSTMSYEYWIRKGDTVINITHEVPKTETAQTELVEKAIATLEIK